MNKLNLCGLGNKYLACVRAELVGVWADLVHCYIVISTHMASTSHKHRREGGCSLKHFFFLPGICDTRHTVPD